MLEWINYLRKRLESSEGLGLIVVAAILGVVIAFGVWVFRSGIEFFHRAASEDAVHTLTPVLGVFAIPVILACAGFFVGWLMDRFVGHERHHGVAGIIEAVAVSGGRLPYKKMPFKAIASMISLGAALLADPKIPACSWVQIQTPGLAVC